MCNHVAPSAAVVATNDQNGDSYAGFAKLDALFDQRHTNAGYPIALQCARDGLGTVAIAVGLENRPDWNVTDSPLDRVQIVPEVPQVYFRSRGAHRVGR